MFSRASILLVPMQMRSRHGPSGLTPSCEQGACLGCGVRLDRSVPSEGAAPLILKFYFGHRAEHFADVIVGRVVVRESLSRAARSDLN